MALDEPRDEDRIIDRGEYRFLLDPRIVELLAETGGLTVDYVDELHQKGYLLRLNASNQPDGCGEGSGGCAGCG
jgi:Fe-S cluster assembly iron-binding protein IscA